MSIDLELLNSSDHGALRLGEALDDGPHFVQIVASEFGVAAVTCPIFLTKEATSGRFYAGAMFGFEPGENLLRRGLVGPAVFRPLDLERQGFYLADDAVAVDPRHSRFAGGQGEALFGADGQPGERLRRIQHALGQLKAGVEQTEVFIQALLAHRLLEPVDIALRFDDAKTLSLTGLYTVSLDALAELDDASALDFFRRGYLQLIYVMAGSLKQVSVLAHRRNELLAS